NQGWRLKADQQQSSCSLGPPEPARQKPLKQSLSYYTAEKRDLLRSIAASFKWIMRPPNLSGLLRDTLAIVRRYHCSLSNSSLMQPARVAIWHWSSLMKSRRQLRQLQ